MAPHERGLRSQTTLGGHPVHPMLIPFPIAFLVGAFASDLAFWVTREAFWAQASAWLIGAGFVTGVIAAVFGAIDFLFIRRVRALNAAWFHFIGNAVVLVLSLWNGAMRMDTPQTSVMPTGLVLSAIVTALLVFTGWFGGELAYRHKIGAIDGEPTGLDAAAHPLQPGDTPGYVTREAQALAEAEREKQQRG